MSDLTEGIRKMRRNAKEKWDPDKAMPCYEYVTCAEEVAVLDAAEESTRLKRAIRWMFWASTIAELDLRKNMLNDAYYCREDGSEVADPVRFLVETVEASCE